MLIQNVEKLIVQGYQITRTDDRAVNDTWRLPVGLRIKHDLAHQELITAKENADRFMLDDNVSHTVIIHVATELERRSKIYNNLLSKVREYLYHALPNWKYDSHLEDYGYKQESYDTIPLSDWVDFNFFNAQTEEPFNVYNYQ